jgi:hypothetical protein
MLRPLRVLDAAGPVPLDTLSPEYLYLVQQSKRLSLVRTLNRFGPRNILEWPLVLAVALVKLADLILSNALIRSLINEHDLLKRVDASIEKER